MDKNRRFLKSNEGEPIVIRNNKRMINKTMVPKQEAYMPEYKRLELEPTVYAHNKDDFRMYTPKKRQVIQEESVQIKPPPFVHSGQNTSWVTDKKTILPDENYNDPINYDDVSLPDEFNDSLLDDVTGSDEEFSLLDIQPGEYVLLCENDVIQFGTLAEIEEAIEKLLLSDNGGEELYSKLFVFKRMGIRTGVFVQDA